MSGKLIVVYERVSSDKQGISRQATQRERAAADYPGREITVIQDDGVSAFKVSVFDRTGGGRLCDLIQEGAVEALYVDAQDRLSRGDDVEWVTFRALCESSDTRVIIDGRELRHDLGGRMEGYLKAVLARQESVEKAHRVRGGMRAAALQGRRNGGPRPYGFDQDDGQLTPRPREVEGGLLMFRWWVEGTKTQTQIACDLTAAGYPSASGKPWSQTQISQQLRDVKWIGHTKRTIDWKEVTSPNTHEAVIPLELFDAAQTRLSTGATPTGRPSIYFLLSGMLRCGRCGSAMKVRRDQKAYGYWEAYLCPGLGCDQPSVQRRLVDPFVHHYFQHVGVDVDAMVEEVRTARDDRLADVRARIGNAEREQTKAQGNIERLRGYLAGGPAHTGGLPRDGRPAGDDARSCYRRPGRPAHRGAGDPGRARPW
jgi:site-specific DNA recombinase